MNHRALEVRCCCQPAKLLGFVDLDIRDLERGRSVSLAPVVPFGTRVMLRDQGPVPLDAIALRVEQFNVCGGLLSWLALKSEDVPLWKLRTMLHFREATEQERTAAAAHILALTEALAFRRAFCVIP